MKYLTFSFVIFCAAAGLLLYPVRKLLVRLGIIDRPNARSSHSTPTARGGGLVLSVLAALGLVACGHASPTAAPPRLLLAAFLGLAAISLWDDIRPLRPLIRFAVQMIAAGMAIAWLVQGKGGVGLGTAGIVLAGVGIVTYTNVFNFMDGINGLASGQVLLTGLGTALLGLAAGAGFDHPAVVLSVMLAGAGLGFLPHNFPRAWVFMGDVGSAPLGFLLAVLALWLARDLGRWLLVPLGLLHANFLLDGGITLLRRLAKGERWYEGHREHFYQRFIRAGKSHSWVTLWEMILQTMVVGLLWDYPRVAALGRIAIGVIVVMLWSFFFLWAEMSWARTRSAGAS